MIKFENESDRRAWRAYRAAAMQGLLARLTLGQDGALSHVADSQIRVTANQQADEALQDERARRGNEK